MKNRILSIFAAIAVTLSLSACQNGNTEQTATLSNSATTIVEETVEIKTIAPPEEGGTLEELLSVTYVYGHQLENPCTLNNSFGGEFDFLEQYEDNKISGGILKHNGISMVVTIFDKCVNDIKDCSETKIKWLYFLSNEYNQDSIIINGVTFSYSKEQVYEKLGKPNISEDTYYIYYAKETENELLILNFDSNQKVIGIHIHY